jgi:hypothetical protein
MLAIMVIVIILVAVFFIYAPAQSQVTLAVDNVYDITNTGTTILVNITLSNSPSCTGWMVDLAWDPYILAVSTEDPNGLNVSGKAYNIYEGSFTKSVRPADIFKATEVNNIAGRIRGLVALYITSGELPKGTGILATINFTVLHKGTTTIEIVGPGTSSDPKQGIIADEKNMVMPHVELYGLVTERSTPPVWEKTDFQIDVVIFETVVLSVLSGILIWKNMPKEHEEDKAGPIYEDDIEFNF